MHDLNDLAYFAAVADHGGFAPAGRALGIPKSKLSRRIAMLEARLGVRLFQRTTRRFSVTETGREFLQHCHAMLAAAEAAEAVVAEQTIEPRGTVRISCPPALLHASVGTMLARFLNHWPQIQIELQSTNQPVDVWHDGVDIALRVRSLDAALPADETVRALAISPHLLVAAPLLLTNAAPPAHPEDLRGLPTVGLRGAREGGEPWQLQGPNDERFQLTHQPRLSVNDMAALHCAALAGVGCAVLPRMLVHDDLEAGRLLALLPDWAPAPWQVQAAFASRRGMRPAVRMLLDALAAGFEELIQEGKCLRATAVR